MAYQVLSRLMLYRGLSARAIAEAAGVGLEDFNAAVYGDGAIPYPCALKVRDLVAPDMSVHELFSGPVVPWRGDCADERRCHGYVDVIVGSLRKAGVPRGEAALLGERFHSDVDRAFSGDVRVDREGE